MNMRTAKTKLKGKVDSEERGEIQSGYATEIDHVVERIARIEKRLNLSVA